MLLSLSPGINQTFLETHLRVISLHILNNFDELCCVVEVDAEVIWNRCEVFICKLYFAVTDYISFSLLYLWVEFLHLLVEEAAKYLSAIRIDEIHSE